MPLLIRITKIRNYLLTTHTHLVSKVTNFRLEIEKNFDIYPSRTIEVEMDIEKVDAMIYKMDVMEDEKEMMDEEMKAETDDEIAAEMDAASDEREDEGKLISSSLLFVDIPVIR